MSQGLLEGVHVGIDEDISSTLRGDKLEWHGVCQGCEALVHLVSEHEIAVVGVGEVLAGCLLYTSPSPRD